MPTEPVRLHRVRAHAVIDPEAMAKCLPPNGSTDKVHALETKVGGAYEMSFTNLSSGKTHSFGGQCLDLVPNEQLRQLRYTDQLDAPNLPIMASVLKITGCSENP